MTQNSPFGKMEEYMTLKNIYGFERWCLILQQSTMIKFVKGEKKYSNIILFLA